jgi:PAS domain S-box-containing protein
MKQDSIIEEQSASTAPGEGSMRSRLYSILHRHPMLFLAVLLFVGMTIILLHLGRLSTSIKESTSLTAAARYSAALTEFRNFYAQEIVPRAKAGGIHVTSEYKTESGAIPIPATLSIELGKQITASGSGARVTVFSDYPFPRRAAERRLDRFERDALAALRAKPTEPYYRFEQFNGEVSLRYALPTIMKKECVNCHNTHPQSPKRDWKEGDVRGVQEVIMPLEKEALKIRTGLFESFGIMMTITLIGLGILWMVIGGFRRSVERTHELAEQQRAINAELQTQIAERQRAEEAVVRSEARLQHLMTSSAAVIFSITPTRPHQLTYISESAESVLGYPASAFLASHDFWREKVHPEDAGIFDNETHPVFDAGFSAQNYRMRQTDGSYKWVHSDLRLIVDESGAPREVVGSVVDITQIKSYEAQLSEYNRSLEANVERRTHELKEKNEELLAAMEQVKETQQQLVTREKLASLGELTAAISHEIKNPLNFINNFATVSVMQIGQFKAEITPYLDAIPAEDREFFQGLIQNLDTNLAKIKEHGTRADSIVKGMLLHSRGISDGFAPFSVNDVLHEYVFLAYHSMRAQDPRFNVTIEEHYDTGLPQIMGSSQDLSRVFLNIVNNAFYATNEKQQALGESFAPMLQVRTTLLDDGARVEVRIRDNGNGIPDHVQKKMFEPFFTTKPSGKGTGLGLSISYEVVKQHSGDIVVDTLAGDHTEFVITLPVTQ